MRHFICGLLIGLMLCNPLAADVYWGNFPDGGTLTFYTNTVGTTGAPITLAGETIAVYKDASDTELTTGATIDDDIDTVTGLHRVVIDTTQAGFDVGSQYTVVYAAGTADSVSVVGRKIGSFYLGPKDANATHVAGQLASASGTVTFPAATLASTTNITAGAITTVGTLTNKTGFALTAADHALIAAKATATAGGYNNVLEVGSGQTYTTITAAQTAAIAGDLIFAHPGTYGDVQLGKEGVSYFLSYGATLTGSDQTDNEDIFWGAGSYRVLGYGKIVGSNPESLILATGAAHDILFECDEIDTSGINNGFSIGNGTRLSVRANRIIGSVNGDLFGLGDNDSVDVTAEFIESNLHLATVGGANSLITFRSPNIVSTCPDYLVNSTNATSTIVIDGIVTFTHASAPGLSAASATTVIIAKAGAVKSPAGRPSLAGSGPIIVSGSFAYDTASATATNIVKTTAAVMAQFGTGLEADGSVYRATTNFLEQGAAGTGLDAQETTDALLLGIPTGGTVALESRIPAEAVTVPRVGTLEDDALGDDQLATTAVDEIGALKPTVAGRTLNVDASGNANSLLQGFLTTPITETTTGRIANNFKQVWHNNNLLTTKVIDDLSGGGGGTTDWTSTERSQIRNRLGIDGTNLAPAATPTLLSQSYFDGIIGAAPTYTAPPSSAENATATVEAMVLEDTGQTEAVSGSAADLSGGSTPALTQQETRDAMKLAASAGAPAADSIDDKIDGVSVDLTGIALTTDVTDAQTAIETAIDGIVIDVGDVTITGGPVSQLEVVDSRVIPLSRRNDGTWKAVSPIRMVAGEAMVWAIELGGRQIPLGRMLFGTEAPASADTDVVTIDATEGAGFGIQGSRLVLKLACPGGATVGSETTVSAVVHPTAGQNINVTATVRVVGP